jgi:uncharacterized protein (DUF2141 family)
MKILFLLPIAFILLSATPTPTTYSLTVKITNISSTKGLVEIGLYNSSSAFPKVGETYKKVRVKPSSDYTCTYTFKGLPSGNYAFAIYHDVNSNDECDVNFLGVPTESYGFSNNVVPTWSAPTFNECSFKMDKNKTLSVKLID